jgi:hypothetical protein
LSGGPEKARTLYRPQFLLRAFLEIQGRFEMIDHGLERHEHTRMRCRLSGGRLFTQIARTAWLRPRRRRSGRSMTKPILRFLPCQKKDIPGIASLRKLNAATLPPPHWRGSPAKKEQSVFAIFTAIIGFLATLILTIVLMNELMPRVFAEWQRGSKSRLVMVGFCIFVVAWIGAYFGYRLGR